MKLCLFLGIRTRGKGMNKYEEKKDIFPKFEKDRAMLAVGKVIGDNGASRAVEEEGGNQRGVNLSGNAFCLASFL